MADTILISGVTGFLGSHLAKKLVLENYKVIGLKRSFSNTKRLDEINHPNISYWDIDQHSLAALFDSPAKINSVIHTATDYGRTGSSITKIIQSNLVFPQELLSLSIQKKVDRFINIDTVLAKHTNPYALSKKQFLEWGKHLIKNTQTRFINVELQHIYGPGDDETKFITYLINQCQKNVPAIPLTFGEQERDFVHVSDAVNALVILLKSSLEQQFNRIELGSGDVIKIKTLAKMIKSLTNSSSYLDFGAIPYRENEAMYLKANTSLLKQMNWKPEVSLETGLQDCLQIKIREEAA